MPFGLTLLKTDATAPGARLGRLTTPHAVVDTPCFMPVGTQAAVKTLAPHEVAGLGSRLILANTYHLFLRPGPELVARAGGLHGFMGWDGAILTDSGGFQVFSLAGLRRITEAGVHFKSHIDGSAQWVSPEESMRVQNLLGADIIMAFDECTPYPATEDEARRSMEMTLRWAERCQKAHARPGEQALFGIVQGGMYPELRRQSAEALAAMDFPGYSVGGLSVGEPKEIMYDVLARTTPHLPWGKPRYLMGVGAPEDLLAGVERGIDMFDCVLPTRVARHGTALTRDGKLSVKAARVAQDLAPIEAECDCYACRHFSRAYIRHLFNADETLGPRLVSLHNLRFLLRLMEEVREAIAADRLVSYSQAFLARYNHHKHGLADASDTV